MSAALASALVTALHVVGGGVWVGAMVFSVLILHPRAESFFKRSADFEDFIFHVVHGARWKVLAGIVVIALSGAALALARPAPAPPAWTPLLALKLALFAASLGLFLYVSWVLWPRRLFAAEAELPPIRRRFWWVGVVMIACNTANMGLGLLARALP